MGYFIQYLDIEHKMSEPLSSLAKRGLLTVEQVQQANPDIVRVEKDDDGYTLLFWACFCCSAPVVEAILDKGVVDINEVLIRGNQTALTGAAESQRWDNVMLLLQRGANAKLAEDYHGRNPLHFSALHGAPEHVITALIEAGADYTEKDGRLQTPADLAHINKHFHIEEFMNQYTNKPIKSANFIA
jgi:ankyrin repeat protein